MQKVDYKKEYKELYFPSAKTPVLVTVPKMLFLMIDGAGYPGDSVEFQEAITALYGMAYTIKFSYKKGEKPKGYHEFVVPPLEGLWWMDAGVFNMARKEDWRWTLMIAQPAYVTKAKVKEALAAMKEKEGRKAAGKIRLEWLREGKCVQIMHIGPYSTEGPTVEKMHNFVAELGYALRGKHHEIYMSDPRRTAPEKMKTVLRQPVEKRK